MRHKFSAKSRTARWSLNKFFFAFLFLFQACAPQDAPPSFKSWREVHQGSYTALKDRDGVLLQEGRIDFQQRQLGWHGLTSFPPALQKELVKIEDQRFWKHPGHDWRALLSGALGVLQSEKRGGSTLTMQVANLLWPELRHQEYYKVQQIRRAWQLEDSWSKENILETYLNYVPMRGEVRGFPAAARIFYGKGHDQLFFSERLWLYSFLPAPNADWRQLEDRACRYGKRLVAKYDCRELGNFRPQIRSLVPQTLAPHLSAYLTPTTTLTTSLSFPLQTKAQEVLARHLRQLRAHNVKDGALMVANRQTGEVLAYVGGIQSEASASHMDHVRAKRQAGSTLKPFLYALTIQSRLLTMDSPLLDAPFAISQEGFTYRPENHDRRFLQQSVPLKEALGSSLNIPAIRAIDLITPERFYELLVRAGFSLPRDSEHYGHSMALGSVDVTLAELVQAYLQLSHGAEAPQLRYTPGETILTKTPFSDEVSSIMSHLLSEKSYRVHSFGLQSVLNTSSWSAVKTGTSKDMRDNWCIGYTDRYVVGVWAGNSSGEPMWDVMGITGAGPIWREMVEYLHASRPSLPPPMHPKLVRHAESYFLAGTEPLSEDLALEHKKIPRILSPTAFGQYAYDPDIPEKAQKIMLKSEGVEKPNWRLNGKTLSTEAVLEGLSVEKRGRYILELLDENEQKLDAINFSVKAGKALRL